MKRAAEDRIRIGQEFIFQRKLARLVRCRDVKMFQYMEHKTETSNHHHVTEGKVCLTMADGSMEQLFDVRENRQEYAELTAQLLLERNPNIEVIFPDDHSILEDAANLFKKLTKKGE